MEVKNRFSACLSNYEVLDILQNMKSYKRQNMNQLATITYQTIKYLRNTPCAKQSPQKIRKFLQDIKRFNLVKAEKLMLLNICPTTPIEIQLMIEENEDRLSEEDVIGILEITKNMGKQADNSASY